MCVWPADIWQRNEFRRGCLFIIRPPTIEKRKEKKEREKERKRERERGAPPVDVEMCRSISRESNRSFRSTLPIGQESDHLLPEFLLHFN